MFSSKKMLLQLFSAMLQSSWSRQQWVNSLAPGRSQCDFENVIFNLALLIGVFKSSYDNVLRSMPQNLTDDKSTLVQVMAWCLTGAVRQQAITLTSVDQDLQRHMASLGPYELKINTTFFNQTNSTHKRTLIWSPQKLSDRRYLRRLWAILKFFPPMILIWWIVISLPLAVITHRCTWCNNNKPMA